MYARRLPDRHVTQLDPDPRTLEDTVSGLVGRVEAVCIGSEPVLAKFPVRSAVVANYGLEGDRHCHPRRLGGLKFNDRQVSIIALEDLEAAERQLEMKIPIGATGDNLVVSGISLRLLEPGDKILIGDEIILAISYQNSPCQKLREVSKYLPKALMGKRGVLCTVMSGVGRRISVGSRVVAKVPLAHAQTWWPPP